VFPHLSKKGEKTTRNDVLGASPNLRKRCRCNLISQI
jgi:hypothetical protein